MADPDQATPTSATGPAEVAVELRDVVVRRDHRQVLQVPRHQVLAGATLGLVGPNGSGKSTMLRTMAGCQPGVTGQIRIADADTAKWPQRRWAQHVALLTQHAQHGEAMTVRASVELGRTSRASWWAPLSQNVDDVVHQAMVDCGVLEFADRQVGSLSGGEQQRVALARALAQEPQVLLLDEVSNHLDIRAVFEVLNLVVSRPVTTVAVLHDLSLAARYCDHLSVLSGGTMVAHGPTDTVLTPQLIDDVFGVHAEVSHRGGLLRVDYAKEPLSQNS